MTTRTATESPSRVLIIEDDRATARDTEASFQGDPAFSVLANVSNIAKAQAFLAKSPVDVILFDLVQQRVDRGREISSIKKLAPHARVLVLTSYDEPERIFRALCAGADGYLLKSDQTRPLVLAVTEVLEFCAAFSPAVANKIARHFHVVGAESRKAGIGKLTTQEVMVLQYLSNGLTNKEIATRLSIAPATAKKHVETICGKLQARNRTHAAVLATIRPSWLS